MKRVPRAGTVGWPSENTLVQYTCVAVSESWVSSDHMRAVIGPCISNRTVRVQKTRYLLGCSRLLFLLLIRGAIKDIGYNDPRYGFGHRTCAIINTIHNQSPDISQGVKRRGAGDQGFMVGFGSCLFL